MVVSDANDTPGKLDVRRVKVVRNSPLRWVIKTYNPWSVRELYDRGYFLVYLDTFGSDRFDYYVLIKSLKTRLKGNVWRDARKGNDFSVARTKVDRVGPYTVSTTVPFRKLRVPKTQVDYRWNVRTIYSKRSCWRAVCLDRAPQFESVVEPLIP